MASDRVAWADEIQLLPSSQSGAVGPGNWVRNLNRNAAEAGFCDGWVTVLDTSGSVIFGERAEPPCDHLEPSDAKWMGATAALQPGTYGVKLLLRLDGTEVQEAVATLTVLQSGCELRAGVLPEVGHSEPLPAPTLVWGADLTLGAGATPGAVNVGCWYQNAGETPADAGAGQGLVNILDTSGSVIDSKWLVGEHGSSDTLQPGESSWAEATFPLSEGIYGVRLQMTVLSVLVDEKTGTLEIDPRGVTLRAGELPTGAPPLHLDVDPSQIAMNWSGALTVDTIDHEISIQAPFTNVGEQEVELGWVQGVCSPIDLSSDGFTGQHFMQCLVPTLAPHDTAPMHGRFHLSAGSYSIQLTLQQTNRVLDSRTIHVDVIDSDSGYGCMWRDE